jgi:hypothetical protein
MKASSELVDAQSLIEASPPGSALFCRVNVGSGWEVAFLIREESERIRQFSRVIEIRSALLIADGVGLIPIMLCPGADDYYVYETWLNFHAPTTCCEKNDHLELLAAQKRLLLFFYGETGKERTIQIANHSENFVLMLERVRRLAPWSMHAFDEARSSIYKEYPTVRSLWAALSGK